MASSTTESNDYGYVWEGSATGTNPIERIWVKGAEGLDDVAAVAFGMDAKGEVVRDTGVISSGKLTFDYVEGMFNCLCPFGSECSAWKLYIWNRNENLGVRDVEWEAGENIPVSNIVDELNAVKQRAKDHTTNIVRALRVPEAGSDNLFVPPVEARKGKVLGFDDDGNPAVGKAVEQIRDLYEIKDTVAGYVDIAASHAQSAERSAQDAAKSAADAQGFAKEAAEHADRAEAAAEVAQSGLSKIEEAVADGINDIEQAASEAASKIEGDISDAVDRAEHAAQSAEEDAEKCEELFSKISQIEVKFDNIQCFVCCAAKQVENTRQLIIELLAGTDGLNPASENEAGYVYMASGIDDERENAAVSASLLKSELADISGSLSSDYAKFEAGTSTAETGAKHGKSLLASQNGEDGGFYVGANRSTTRAWTQNMTRYRQTGVRAYGETTGKHEDYLWSPQTEEDEPLRVARLKDFERIVNPTLVVSTKGEKTEEPDENANMTAWVGTLGALKGLEEDDATAIVPDAVSVWRRTSGTTVNASLDMRMKIMRWDEASGVWAIAAKSKETRVWSNFANGEEIKFTFAWEGEGIPANEKVIVGFVRMSEEDDAAAFTQASCAQTTTRSGAMTVAPGLSTREPAVQEYAPVMRLGTARVLTPAGIEELIAGAESGGGGSGVTEEWVRSNFVPLVGDFRTSGAGTFGGTTTFGGEVNVLSGKVVRFRNGEGNTAVSLRFTDSPTGGVLNQGSASTTTAMTWMSGNYMSWFSSEFLRMYSGESVVSPTSKVEVNPNGVILAAGAGDAAKIVIDAGRIQVSGAPLTLNVAPTAANHATTKGYVDDKVAALEAKIAALKERIEALEELPGTGDIRLRIETTSANQSFPLFYQITTEEGGFVSVDWGDGNTETLTGATTYSPRHTYATAGEYVVKLTGSKFTGINGRTDSYNGFQDAVREILSLKMPKDSTSVSLSNTFYRCAKLTGSIPEWDANITNAYSTYNSCSGLTGNIPAWGANIMNAYGTYARCSGLTGDIPAWGANITNAYSTYNSCSGLTGNIPAWGAKITNAHQTYRGCTGLTGNIPEWRANIMNAYGTYARCSGLTGDIPAWGANITSTQHTYAECSGLTGNIPAWGAKITNAYATYQGCRGLTGCSEELLQDPMPSRITYHSSCVSGCVDEIRKHFTPDWGGTKAELPGTGDIRLRIQTTSANQSFSLFRQITTEEGGYVSVDWGDGNTETLTGATTYSPVHTYATTGEYVVKLTGSKFTELNGYGAGNGFQNAVRKILSLKMPTDSVGVSLYYTFSHCRYLTRPIPRWDDCITEAFYTYLSCRGLDGGVPAWGVNITNASGTYNDCIGLTGSIPEWGANITNAYATYQNCLEFTGSIPEWGVKLTDVSYTYNGCKKLWGCSAELLRDPMPSRITSHADCVSGCADAIRQHFTSDWGGTKAS